MKKRNAIIHNPEEHPLNQLENLKIFLEQLDVAITCLLDQIELLDDKGYFEKYDEKEQEQYQKIHFLKKLIPNKKKSPKKQVPTKYEDTSRYNILQNTIDILSKIEIFLLEKSREYGIHIEEIKDNDFPKRDQLDEITTIQYYIFNYNKNIISWLNENHPENMKTIRERKESLMAENEEEKNDIYNKIKKSVFDTLPTLSFCIEKTNNNDFHENHPENMKTIRERKESLIEENKEKKNDACNEINKSGLYKSPNCLFFSENKNLNENPKKIAEYNLHTYAHEENTEKIDTTIIASDKHQERQDSSKEDPHVQTSRLIMLLHSFVQNVLEFIAKIVNLFSEVAQAHNISVLNFTKTPTPRC